MWQSTRRHLLGVLVDVAFLGAALLVPIPATAAPRIVATLADLWAITRELVDGQVEVDLATKFGQNPHDMEIRPSQILLVKRADLLIRNGLEEDMWIDPIVESSGNPKLLRGSANVVEAVRGVQALKVPAGPVDRSMGDVHPLGNPHFDFDPRNLPAVTANIVSGLSWLMPERAAAFEASRKAFLEKAAYAYERWKKALAPYRGAGLVSYHDSWPYFEQAFDLSECGIIEDRPGIPPSPQHLLGLIRRMKENRCAVILHESWYPRDVSDFVARRSGARLVIVPQIPGALPGTADYFQWMDRLVGSVADALSAASLK
jgi:zinc/manganese transport system substrate-binding protein